VTINTCTNIPVDMSRNLLKRTLSSPSLNPVIPIAPHPRSLITTQGLVLVRGTKVRVVDPTEAGQQLGLAPHSLLLSTNIPIYSQDGRLSAAILRDALSQMLPTHTLTLEKDVIALRSIRMILSASLSVPSHMLSLEWNWTDEALASHVISIAKQFAQDSRYLKVPLESQIVY